ncbi:dolichyl-phosphate-mannose-protein mannosyltransferase [Rhodocollybia butyracea]|uniref:Dolichyl-phosphate-mannose--protein mannosyltransferase n=1 Tax=Rhodocollybia butyracea TaxID=206335 RepID=A0A9P5PRV2_9AGAR|nr:dolichyl-phosphate-mannose-protein mannosyltransferase [Rhodocollybia butyracea]
MNPVGRAVAIDFGEDEFEEIGYPDTLPTYSSHMDDSAAARRRLGKGRPEEEEEKVWQEDDDNFKAPVIRSVSGGRPAQPVLPPPTTLREFLSQNMPSVPPLVYTLLACYTRFHKIGLSGIVVWDEAHFGKFASHYLKREFYFDVHPPLGKMLVGLAGLLSGYNGGFDFKSGVDYPPEVPYVAMRVMLATFGVGMVPLGWFTALELGMTQWAAHLVALMVLFDVGWLCISRFILLDSMLLFFTLFTVFCLSKFHNQQSHPFDFDWWTWLAMTGISIGLVTSVKMVGLFVTALVGIYTLEDLWDKFGDLRLTVKEQAKHWAARVLCLIILPILVFMACFKIHFMILNHSGPGDAQMSSLFQANLRGNDFRSNPLEITIGSKVTIKNMGWGTYPTGSNQQQVTCYHYRDENNEFFLWPSWNDKDTVWEKYGSHDPKDEELRFLKHGDVIRLVHAPTTRNIHSHPIPAPVTKANWEVSAYGNATIGDIQDHWVVEVLSDVVRGDVNRYLDPKSPSVDSRARIHALTTRLRFRHQSLGCYLSATRTSLPTWGFKQIEVSCLKEDDVTTPTEGTIWNVESHWNDRLPPADRSLSRSPFLTDFIHLNIAMMASNNALVPDPDKEDLLASKPLDWPFLNVGLRMCGWGDGNVKYYLMGNPVIWWGGAASLILVSFVALGLVIRRQRYGGGRGTRKPAPGAHNGEYTKNVSGMISRPGDGLTPREWAQFWHVTRIAGGGWALHFLPFLIMGRVTYIHHYLPTLYFAVLMFAHLLDYFVFQAPSTPSSTSLSTVPTSNISLSDVNSIPKIIRTFRALPRMTRIKLYVFITTASAIVGTFWWFRAVAWGIEGPVTETWGLGWRESWNIYH